MCRGWRACTRDIDAWAGITRCVNRGVDGHGEHLVSEFPAMQDRHDKRPYLFVGTRADAVVSSIWEDDMISMVRSVNECPKPILCTSQCLRMAGKDEGDLSCDSCQKGRSRTSRLIYVISLLVAIFNACHHGLENSSQPLLFVPKGTHGPKVGIMRSVRYTLAWQGCLTSLKSFP